MTILRLLLGDQLNPRHSWFEVVDPRVLHILMEVRQETDYVLHHAQKILGIFAAMRDFARQLRSSGHRVYYLAIDDPENLHDIPANLDRLIAHHRVAILEYQAPDEWRLDQQLADYVQTLAIPARMVDSEHFLTQRDDAAGLFGARKHWRMETFYRHMRAAHSVLMEPNRQPVAGRWNFDTENRKSWPGIPQEPSDRRPVHDHRILWSAIAAAGIRSFGEPHAEDFRWPLNRDEALQQLDAFVQFGLPHFGDYQDAMSVQAKRLFHSLLSFALNVKMLSPREVIARAESAWRAGNVPLAAAEGFIRQILGWREYVRGVYWARMPAYAKSNAFAHHRDLPAWFWTGATKMNCLHHAITHSLEHAHAHHIQRLMLTGNFALLAGLDPEQVHRWYLGIYIDAFEWVELPNTLGMSQYADGGLLATKPYVSAAAYIHRMSDYCRGCQYRRDEQVSENACPFNALYWDFLARHRRTLADNPRLALAYRQLGRRPQAHLAALRDRAAELLNKLDEL
ncbi:cryptochrome/photolyase family protein [Dyella lipolytica]|uniref:Cryptochrome/photolyase family protein n=1 Tax=Dyella lipolytica TaxID=1867835 RepID=A0ABW8IXZ7_9GAMM|nr:cryptochrome/photolyase family protein [Dyella lipolytica]GLQ45973.1 cryptochrome/photolyase family protein [Dyella lipolytica]